MSDSNIFFLWFETEINRFASLPKKAMVNIIYILLARIKLTPKELGAPPPPPPPPSSHTHPILFGGFLYWQNWKLIFLILWNLEQCKNNLLRPLIRCKCGYGKLLKYEISLVSIYF